MLFLCFSLFKSTFLKPIKIIRYSYTFQKNKCYSENFILNRILMPMKATIHKGFGFIGQIHILYYISYWAPKRIVFLFISEPLNQLLTREV